MENRYWVFDWLTENQISSAAEAKKLLPKYKVLDSLRIEAEQAATKPLDPGPSSTSIVAGAGIDLSGGGMVCLSPKCMRKQVDTLLKHAWHYFDTVIAADVLTPLLSSNWNGTKKDLLNTIVPYLEPLIYLNEIGATELVRFSRKELCLTHWKQQAKNQNLDRILDSEKDVVEYLISSGTFEYIKLELTKDGPKSPALRLLHPELPSAAVALANGQPERVLKHRLATRVYRDTVSYLAADIGTARAYQLPLGSTMALEGKLLHMSHPASVPDVIFHLDLPILEQIPMKALIDIREQEHDAFNVFRGALRKAAAERLNLGESQSAAALAEQIRLDVIEPSLDGIRLRLAKAEGALTKKVGVGVFLGALATTCGLLLGLPPSLAASAGIGTTVTATGTAAAKFLDEKTDVSLEEMYFLWKAIEHSH